MDNDYETQLVQAAKAAVAEYKLAAAAYEAAFKVHSAAKGAAGTAYVKREDALEALSEWWHKAESTGGGS